MNEASEDSKAGEASDDVSWRDSSYLIVSPNSARGGGRANGGSLTSTRREIMVGGPKGSVVCQEHYRT